ncbi:TolC family protein [Siccirubricoccus deserti]
MAAFPGWAALAGAAVLLGGCSWLTPGATTSGIGLPARLAAADAAAPVQWPDPLWWRGFGAPELDGLMAEAMAANTDIAAAEARIRQADAQVRITGAALLPSIDLTAQALRQQSGGASAASITGVGRTTSIRVSSSDRLALSASYEIDFWGKNRAATEAAQQAASASRFSAGTITLTTQAAVANTYFAMLAAQDQLALQQQNLEIAGRVLRVIRDRVSVGTATGLDLAQQETVLAQQQAQVPPLQQLVEQNRIHSARWWRGRRRPSGWRAGCSTGWRCRASPRPAGRGAGAAAGRADRRSRPRRRPGQCGGGAGPAAALHHADRFRRLHQPGA